MQNTFREKAVIITGASSRICKALILRLADKGAWIVLAARNAQHLDALSGECRKRGIRAIAIPTVSELVDSLLSVKSTSYPKENYLRRIK